MILHLHKHEVGDPDPPRIQVVAGPRASGRTTRMLQWLLQPPKGEVRILLVCSTPHAKAIYAEVVSSLEKAKVGNVPEVWQIISVNQLLAGVHIPPIAGNIVFGIDDAEHVVTALLGPNARLGAIAVETET